MAKVPLRELTGYLDGLLQPERFDDYCPNGLQLEGGQEVSKIVSGVTASLKFMQEAVKLDADAILVHHGWFWNSEPRTVTGSRKRRIQFLLDNNISLIAYHLPLDYHSDYGNNVQLARVLDIEVTGALEPGPTGLGCTGRLAQSLSPEDLAAHIEQRLNRKPLIIGEGADKITTLGWCTGAAQHWMDWAIEKGVDAFMSGEVSEPNYHQAHEHGIYYIAAGHHATERYGVQALGQHLAEHFGIRHEFVNVENPV